MIVVNFSVELEANINPPLELKIISDRYAYKKTTCGHYEEIGEIR